MFYTHHIPHNFPSFNLSMFTEEYGTTIDKGDRKKIPRFTQFCNF